LAVGAGAAEGSGKAIAADVAEVTEPAITSDAPSNRIFVVRPKRIGAERNSARPGCQRIGTRMLLISFYPSVGPRRIRDPIGVAGASFHEV
jgi:hypothetical protein